MRISLRRLPNGDLAFQRIVLRANATGTEAEAPPQVRRVKTPKHERSFIDTLLCDKGRAMVARIDPRFRQPKLQVIRVHCDEC
jgi:hypothetical protein